jgi:hypothetical protein
LKLDNSDLRWHPDCHIYPEVFYLVVYPNGDDSRVSVATVQYFDVRDYDLASKFKFSLYQNAVNYGRRIAQAAGLKFDGNRSGGGALLDRVPQ